MKNLGISWLPVFLFFSFPAIAALSPVATTLEDRLKNYQTVVSEKDIETFKKDVLEAHQKAVPLLTKIMKDSKYPIKVRWVSTFLLGRIMREKSAPFVAKFFYHPDWMMRLASLKVLLIFKQDSFQDIYAQGLKDPSLIVRVQALENVRRLNLQKLAPQVWSMLYDEDNYRGAPGNRKRIGIFSSIVKTVGDLQYQPAKTPLLVMAQNKKYQDLFLAVDYSLTKLTKQASPSGPEEKKRKFWKEWEEKDTKIKNSLVVVSP